MRQSQVQPGLPVMLSLGRRGAIRATVVRQRFAPGVVSARAFWTVTDSRGDEHTVSARELSPVPVTDRAGNLLGHLAIDGSIA